MKKLFYGRIKIEQATALFYFQKNGIVQKIIHQLKYQNQKQLGAFFGKWLGQELKDSGRFDTVDAVVGVPMHKRKLKSRGYNQITLFGLEISKALNVPYY
ncbi:MAG: ComF family protein, partial [Flavobacteriaceae bacterium]|nr:ComF family protein [Flavobacteriaceae bacterium]